MSSTSAVVLASLIIYKIMLLGIGVWASFRNKTSEDFFLGGRALGPWVAGLSYAASTSSAWVILGFSGFVYSIGVSAVWMVPGIWAGYAVVWLYFGPRLHRESNEHQHITSTDFLLQDAPASPYRRRASLLAASLILACFIFYIAAQFDAAGTAFAHHFSLSVTEATLVGATIVLVYALLGGFWAVSVTDTIQAGVMLIVCVSVPAATLIASGGYDAVLDKLLLAEGPAYLAINGGHPSLVFIGFVMGSIGMSLGALGQPHLMSRLMAIKGNKERRQGFAIAISWGIVVFVGMIFLGLAGRAALPDLASSEVLFYASAEQFLPPVLAGIVVAATLSAVMSTVDSILLAASGAVAHDMGFNARYPGYAMLISRLSMLLIAALAIALTLTLPDSIFNRVLFAWSALGAAFGPIVLWRCLGFSVSAKVAFWSMLSGFSTTVMFYSLGTMGGEGQSSELLVQAALLPGDPFERVFPWLPPLVILLMLSRKQTPSARTQS